MPITKEKFKQQYERALARVGQLKELGKTDEEIIKILSGEKYYASVISKIFKLSGPQLARKKVEEDAKLAEKDFKERLDSKKPIRAKEIEDAAWFHNLLHDLGKYVYHKMVRYVDWTDEDMENYDHARRKLSGFIDSIHALIEDSGKVQRLEDENTLLEIKLTQAQHVLQLLTKRLETLKWFNDMLISVMTPEVRLRALNQMIAASTMKVMPEGLAKAEAEAKAVD